MKFHDNGCFYSVSVTAREVSDFAERWPCANLPDRSVWFQFDKSNGDLVDMQPNLEEQGADGGAVLALSQDAQAYGKAKL